MVKYLLGRKTHKEEAQLQINTKEPWSPECTARIEILKCIKPTSDWWIHTRLRASPQGVPHSVLASSWEGFVQGMSQSLCVDAQEWLAGRGDEKGTLGQWEAPSLHLPVLHPGFPSGLCPRNQYHLIMTDIVASSLAVSVFTLLEIWWAMEQPVLSIYWVKNERYRERYRNIRSEDFYFQSIDHDRSPNEMGRR